VVSYRLPPPCQCFFFAIISGAGKIASKKVLREDVVAAGYNEKRWAYFVSLDAFSLPGFYPRGFPKPVISDHRTNAAYKL
jgi:hypothetical protein